MDNVPVWVLTAVIEVALLGSGTLGLVTILFWRQTRRLRSQVTQLLEAVATPAEAVCMRPMEDSASAVLEAVSPVLPVADQTGTPDTPSTTILHPVATEGPITPSPVTVTEVAGETPTVSETVVEVKPTITLSQNLLDALLAASIDNETIDQEPAQMVGDVQQSVAAMLSENAVMEQQISDLQAKGQRLREVIDTLQANANLPLAKQQASIAPEHTMQEMEQGLTALQQTHERLLQQLQTHCQLLGFDDPLALEMGEGEQAGKDAAMRPHDEILHLKAELDRRTMEFQRVQDEYDQLLGEYQRVYVNAARS
jgi:hypothetical protein